MKKSIDDQLRKEIDEIQPGHALQKKVLENIENGSRPEKNGSFSKGWVMSGLAATIIFCVCAGIVVQQGNVERDSGTNAEEINMTANERMDINEPESAQSSDDEEEINIKQYGNLKPVGDSIQLLTLVNKSRDAASDTSSGDMASEEMAGSLPHKFGEAAGEIQNDVEFTDMKEVQQITAENSKAVIDINGKWNGAACVEVSVSHVESGVPIQSTKIPGHLIKYKPLSTQVINAGYVTVACLQDVPILEQTDSDEALLPVYEWNMNGKASTVRIQPEDIWYMPNSDYRQYTIVSCASLENPEQKPKVIAVLGSMDTETMNSLMDEVEQMLK